MMRLWFVWIAVAMAVPLAAQTVTGDRFSLNSGPCVTRSGSGTPEGAVLGNLCDTYHRTDTGALYLKLVGTATTSGWMLLSSTISTPPAMNLILAPTGDLVTDPAGKDILPNTPYDINIGMLSNKYLTLHAAELWVETLVAQNTIATIGGRILVAPTNILVVDLAAVSTTLSVKYNNFLNGDRIYMEADGKVEFMSVDSAPSGGGPYSYTVTRNLDGTGANQWYAGDALLNTGTTGNGFIDLYSLNGVLSSGAGPSIVGNVRTGTTYNAYAPRWAIGNLNGLYGYASSIYGTAFGDAAATNVTVDATNGFRIRSGIVDKLVADVAGNLSMVGNLTVGSGGIIHTAAATTFTTGAGFYFSGPGPPATSKTVNVLVVAGGSGGGRSLAGGGAAGGVRTDTAFSISEQAYTVTVGAGGAGATSTALRGSAGSDSVFGSITATGGGGGGSGAAATGDTNRDGGAGGSGGGGSWEFPTDVGGLGTAGQGNDGGNGSQTGGFSGGGGGGAGAVGGNGSGDNGGNGGNGTSSSISGAAVTYAGGGGGAGSSPGTAGTGGTGGGGAGTNDGPTNGGNGTVNRGSGGGGARATGAGAGVGGNGGSGVVIVSYPTDTLYATGGTVSTSGGNTIHTFTTSGTFTVTAAPPSLFRVGNPGGNLLAWDGTTLTIAGNGSGLTSISGGQIVTGSITATQIAASTITATQIAASTITATQIAAGTITADKLNVTNLSAITANIGDCDFNSGAIECGAVTLDETGIVIDAGTASANAVKWSSGPQINGFSGGTLSMSNISSAVISVDSGATYSFAASKFYMTSGNPDIGDSSAGGRWATVYAESTQLSDLGGTGNDYVCVDGSGNLFRGSGGC